MARAPATVAAPRCTGPQCQRPAIVGTLCTGHYAQQRRAPGEPLRPLRSYGEGKARENVTIRVSADCRTAVLKDPEGARAALERWAARRS